MASGQVDQLGGPVSPAPVSPASTGFGPAGSSPAGSAGQTQNWAAVRAGVQSGQFAGSSAAMSAGGTSPAQRRRSSTSSVFAWLTGSKKELVSAETELANAQAAALAAMQQQQQLEQMLEQQRQDSRKQQEMMQQQLEQMTKLHQLEKEKAELLVHKLTADLAAAIAERDEAVCAATRAMMPPALEGEELDVLMSVLPEEEQEKERTRLSLSPPAKPLASAATPVPAGHHELKDASSASYV